MDSKEEGTREAIGERPKRKKKRRKKVGKDGKS